MPAPNRETGSQSQKPSLDYVFHPESIAIAGVADGSSGFNAGRSFLEVLLEAGFKGKIYPINPKGGEVSGLKIYPSLSDVPHSVDYVISAVPARHAPQLMSECIAKKAKVVHFFSAGFSESGNEAGRQLESQISSMARQSGVRITGPNGMGLYCPRTGLAFSPGLPRESGQMGFLSQSGSNVSYVIRQGGARGLYFSKAVSYGNAADLNESDFIEYFCEDTETGIIGAYIEGVKDGRRFAEVLRRTAAQKPVVVLKGGATEAGERSVASHTGSIAGAERTWFALLRQARAVQVYSNDELVDVALIFRFMSPPEGRNIVIIGFGGGIGVHAADLCTRVGLRVPPVPPELRAKLRAIWPAEAGSSLGNPVDLFGAAGEKGIELTIRTIAGWEQAQLLLVHVPVFVNPRAGLQILQSYTTSLVNLAPQISNRTAVVLSFVLNEGASTAIGEATAGLHRAGFPVFFSIEHAVGAIAKFVDFHERNSS